MFTVCPKCALTLVVTAADLRVAQGYVRCGRCSSVFNALARLSDERQSTGAAAPADHSQPDHSQQDYSQQDHSPGLSPPPDAQPQRAHADDWQPDQRTEAGDELRSELPGSTEEEAIPEDALEFNPAKTDVSSVFIEQAPSPEWTAATGSFRAMVAANQEAAPEDLPDSQVEVEVDAAFLASISAHVPAAPKGTATAAPKGTASPPPPPPPTPLPPPGDATPEREDAAEPDSPAPDASTRDRAAHAMATAAPHNPTSHAAAAPAATKAPASRSRTAVRHAAPHARPAIEARPRSAPGSALEVPASGPGQPAPASVPGVRVSAAGAGATVPQASAVAPTARGAGATTETADLLAGFAQRDSASPEAESASRWTALAWRVGAAVAVLALLVQILNHYRDDLAASPRLNRPLTALYGAIGVRLVPRWDLRAYDVRQLGAALDPAGSGTITVRASIKNAAQQPQPLPLLRVTLQDRFGNRIASSDVAPRDYVPRAIPASAFLSAGQRIDAQMGFVDPGANAVGFELDACLPASGGGIACANDAAGR